MSIKRQIKYKYHNIKFSLLSMSLPGWFTSRAMRIGLLSIIFIFGGAYIFNISASATSGYEMKLIEERTQDLKTEVQKLEVAIADYSSISSIAKRVQGLSMVESAGVKHFAVKNNEVAKR